MEGHKQYILPALAALVLLILFIARNQAFAPEPVEAVPTTSEPAPPPPMGTKAAIRAAVQSSDAPPLDEAAQSLVHEALAPIVDRCRASRPQASTVTVTVALDVLSAAGVGVFVDRAEVKGELPADLVGCVREGMLSAKPGDIGKTGQLHATLEYTAS